MKSLFNIFPLLFILLVACGEKKDESPGTSSKSTEERSDEKTVDRKVILFFGNSLTAGMGLETSKAFPALIQEKLDSMDLTYEVVNAGLSGETTASGRNRIEWVLNQEVDIFVLELGANDGLRGIPVKETRQNLQEIIDIVKSKNPDTRIILAGMQIPPNLGKEYTQSFKNIYPGLAKKNNIELVPFLLEDVAGVPALNQSDGIHPTAEGHKILAENVWEVLEPVVKEQEAQKKKSEQQ